MKKLLLSILACAITLFAQAQTSSAEKPADIKPTTEIEATAKQTAVDLTSISTQKSDANTKDDCTITIGNSTTTSNAIPVSTRYLYSYSQQIFDAADLGSAPAIIYSVSFQYIYATAQDRNNVKIYLANTSQSTFAGWFPISQLQEVYYGTIHFDDTGENFWVTIVFDTPFSYTGNNIVLAVLNNEGISYTGANYTFRTHETVEQKALYRITDSGLIVPSDNMTPTHIMKIRNNVQFGICSQLDCPPITTFPWTEGFETFDLSTTCWTFNSNGGTNWQINTNTSYVHQGTKSIYHNVHLSAQSSWLISPKISIPASGMYTLNFWSRNVYTADYGKNSVLISTSSNKLSDFVEVWSPASVTNSWVETTIDLSAYSGSNIYIAFRYEGNYAHMWYVDDVSVSVSSTEGINKFDSEANNVRIYPNPTTGIVNIEVDVNSRITILNISGKILSTHDVVDKATLNINQPAGVYFIRSESESGISTRKFIINN